MKKFLLTAALLAACGASYATNVIRIPVPGMEAALAKPGNTPPTGVLPSKPTAPAEPDEPLVQGPKLIVDSTLSFGAVPAEAVVTRTLVMRNGGNQPVVFSEISVDGGNFQVDQGQSTCDQRGSLAPGARCNLVIGMTGPGFAGVVTDSISIYSDDYNEYTWVAVNAQATGYPLPMVATTAPQGVLGIFEGTATTGLGSYQYVYKNPTEQVRTITSLSVRGEGSGQTSATFSDNTCSGAINPGASCSFTLNPNTAQPGVITLKFAETPLMTTTRYVLVGEVPSITSESRTVSGNTISHTFTNPNKIVPVDFDGVSIQNSSYVDSSSHYKITGCLNRLLPGESCTMNIEYLPETGVQSSVSTGIYYFTSSNKTSRSMLFLYGSPWW